MVLCTDGHSQYIFIRTEGTADQRLTKAAKCPDEKAWRNPTIILQVTAMKLTQISKFDCLKVDYCVPRTELRTTEYL